MKKYYFIYYSCHRVNYLNGIFRDEYNQMYQDIIDIHPIQYQIECNEKYSKIHESDGDKKYTHKEEYKIITWNNLTKAEYEKYKGRI